jgi:hypothetical protein
VAEDPLREIMGAAAEVLRATGERWAALVAHEDLGDEQLEAAWAEDAEILCAALRTLGGSARRRGSPSRPPGSGSLEQWGCPSGPVDVGLTRARPRAPAALGPSGNSGN